jgi:predicted DCC family thiol-disulfide oxidoreductase YuxK
MTPTLIFDGDCGFCTTSAHWVEERVPPGIRVIAWQKLGEASLAELGLTTDDVTTAAWWVDANGRCFRGHEAVAKTLEAIGGPWRPAGRLVRTAPVSWLAAPGYQLVARYRYRLPGATPACKLER